MAAIVQEFHANLPHRDCSTVFVRGVWVSFDSAIINGAFKLQDEVSKAYRELFKAPNCYHILKNLKNGKRPWKTNFTKKFISFKRICLNPTERV